MNQLQSFGIGRVLAIVGLALVVVLLVVGRLAFIPEGLLFLLAFAALVL